MVNRQDPTKSHSNFQTIRKVKARSRQTIYWKHWKRFQLHQERGLDQSPSSTLSRSNYQGQNMKDWILLDNESTTTIFCNPDMVQDIRNIEDESLDLVTNACNLRTTQKATIPGWGEAWFNPNAITNIFSYAEMAKRHCITYDSNKEDAFNIYLPDQTVKFTNTNQGLYVFKPKIKKTSSIRSQFVTTVIKN
jgi:hypothetical protein